MLVHAYSKSTKTQFLYLTEREYFREVFIKAALTEKTLALSYRLKKQLTLLNEIVKIH